MESRQRIVIDNPGRPGERPGDMPPLPGYGPRKEVAMNQYVSQVPAPAPAEAAATSVTAVGIQESLHRQQENALRRFAAFQPVVEPGPSAGEVMATKVRVDDSLIHGRRR